MIKAVITDFDGTLVDTFEANFLAYQYAFSRMGLTLTAEKYRECFGLRFDRFMETVGVGDEVVANSIREIKRDCYPDFFVYLRPNRALMELISAFRMYGGKAAIASTASRENLTGAVRYLHLEGLFNLIYAGQDVKEGKPSPEIYVKAMARLGVSPADTLIFEDSEAGVLAAQRSGAHLIKIDF